VPTPQKHESRAARQKAYRRRQADARLAERKAKGLPRAPPISTMPGAARWTALREQAHALLETLRKEMDCYWDERSELWQESDRGEEMRESIERIDEILAVIQGI